MVEVKEEPAADLPVEVQLLVEGVDTLSEADVINYILGAGIHPDNFEVTSAEISHSNEAVTPKAEAGRYEGKSSFISKLKRLLKDAADRNRSRGCTDIEGLVFLCPKERKKKGKRKPSYKYKKLFFKHYQLGQQFKKQQENNRKTVDELKKKIKVLREKSRSQVESEVRKILGTFLSDNHAKLLFQGETNINWKKEDFIHAFTLKSISPRAYQYLIKMMKFPLPGDGIMYRWLTRQSDEKKSQVLDCCIRMMRKYYRIAMSNMAVPSATMVRLNEIIMENIPSSDCFTAVPVKTEGEDGKVATISVKPLSKLKGTLKKTIPPKVKKRKSMEDSDTSIDDVEVFQIEESVAMDSDDPEWVPTSKDKKHSVTNTVKHAQLPVTPDSEPPSKRAKTEAEEDSNKIEELKSNLEQIFGTSDHSSEELEENAPGTPPDKKSDQLQDALKVLEQLSEAKNSPATDGRSRRMIKPTQRLIESDALSRKLSMVDDSMLKRQFARKSTKPLSTPAKQSSADSKKTESSDKAKSSKSTVSAVSASVVTPGPSNVKSKNKSNAELEESSKPVIASSNPSKAADSNKSSPSKAGPISCKDVEKLVSDLHQGCESPKPEDDKNPSPDPAGTPKMKDSVKQVLLMRTRRSTKRNAQTTATPQAKKSCSKSDFLSNLSIRASNKQ